MWCLIMCTCYASCHEIIYLPIILHNFSNATCMLTTTPCSFWAFLTSNLVKAYLCLLNANQHHASSNVIKSQDVVFV
jgi:hypothetical protein